MRTYLPFALVSLLAVGCGGDDSEPTPDAPTTPPIDSGPGTPDSGPGTPDSAPGTPDSAPGTPDAAGGQTFTLTINNYLAWCSITEEGAPYMMTMSFPEGTVVDLHGAPLAAFVWGYWTGTDGDVGSPTFDRDQDTTVTMTSDKSVLACCPFPPPASQTCP
jgi:hypothetical protein